MLSIGRKELAPQPVLFTRRRVSRADLPNAIGEGLGQAMQYANQNGVPIAGPPFVRYIAMGPGLMTLEIGLPIAASSPASNEVEAGTLPGGSVVVAVHGGAYDRLGDTYAEIERWMEANGLRAGGAPWESYITDPAAFPNPDDWRTEIYWPVVQS